MSIWKQHLYFFPDFYEVHKKADTGMRILEKYQLIIDGSPQKDLSLLFG